MGRGLIGSFDGSWLVYRYCGWGFGVIGSGISGAERDDCFGLVLCELKQREL